MSSKRKSNRGKKIVDYSSQGSDKDDPRKRDSDEDFEVDFTPPTKKAKVKINNLKTKSKETTNKRPIPSERLSLDDKLYERDTEKAVKLSLSTAQQSEHKNHGKNGEKNERAKLNVDCVEIINSSGEEDETVEDDSSPAQDKNHEDADIERENKNNLVPPSSGRLLANAERRLSSGGSENKKHDAKAKVKGKQTLEKEGRTSSLSKSVKSPLGQAGGRKNPFLTGVVIKNPGPPIRVGLSRNRKVKPLHPNVTTEH